MTNHHAKKHHDIKLNEYRVLQVLYTSRSTSGLIPTSVCTAASVFVIPACQNHHKHNKQI